MSLILLKDIRKEFIEANGKSNVVLTSVSVEFPTKGFFVIEGISGAGKSTLIKIIARIMNPTSGQYFYQDKSLGNSEEERARFRNNEVGLLFQDYQLIDNLNALENVMLPLLINGVETKKAKRKATSLFKTFHLLNKMNMRISMLSGGEKQRIAFLRAMSVNPTFYLCDEPTGALDEYNSELLLSTLKEASKEKLVIVVTHNPLISKRYATKTYLLKDGRLYEK